MNASAQRSKGKCEVGWYGMPSLEKTAEPVKVDSTNKNDYFHYCVKKIDNYAKQGEINEKKRAYYKVKIFFKFDLPVLGDIFTYGITGETIQIQYPGDCLTFKTCS